MLSTPRVVHMVCLVVVVVVVVASIKCGHCEHRQNTIIVMLLDFIQSRSLQIVTTTTLSCKQILTKEKQEPEPPMVGSYNEQIFEPVLKDWMSKTQMRSTYRRSQDCVPF